MDPDPGSGSATLVLTIWLGFKFLAGRRESGRYLISTEHVVGGSARTAVAPV